MSKYQENKNRVRQDVINQLDDIFYPGMSILQLADVQEKLYRIAKKYGLVKEFRENAII